MLIIKIIIIMNKGWKIIILYHNINIDVVGT